MATQIFVPISKHGQIDDLIPYLEALARPGMEIVFLTRYRIAVSWMEVQLNAIQTGLKTTPSISALIRDDSRRNVRICEENVRRARNLLKERGSTISHQCYGGRLRDAIASLRNPEDEMILLMEEKPKAIRKLLRRLAKVLGRFHTVDTTPIVFLLRGRQY
jgi:hypothetical protein